MQKEVSNKVVIVMVFIALLVSLTSTYLVTVYVSNIGNYNSPIQKEVKTYYIQEPSSTNGYVSINVLPKQQGSGSDETK